MAIPACCRFALRVSVAIGFRLVWGQEKGASPELYRSLLAQGNGKGSFRAADLVGARQLVRNHEPVLALPQDP
jgi:hypothetical protein